MTAQVLQVDGPLRTPVARELRHCIRGLLRGGERRIVLDVSQVANIDAAGIGELVRAYNMARAVNGALRVEHASAWVREVIERAGLQDVLLHEPHGGPSVNRHPPSAIRHALPAR